MKRNLYETRYTVKLKNGELTLTDAELEYPDIMKDFRLKYGIELRTNVHKNL